MEAQRRHGDRVRFVGVPGLADTASMTRFVDETGTGGFPHLPDLDGELWERFGVHRHRAYVFVNDDGSARLTGYGDLEAEVEALIES